MKRNLAATVAIFTLLALPAQAEEAPCPDPARPIHYMPYCLTEAEWLELSAPRGPEIVPEAVSVAPVDLVRTIAYHFWPDWAAERMIRIAQCESGYLPTAQHPRSGAAGIWQIMPFWQRAWPGDYFDPWTNGAVAYQIWLVQGFGAWVCRG